jgi:hypothetical protein
MTDDYLWDRSGEADAEVVRLEQLLRPLGHGGQPLQRMRAARVVRAPAWRRVGAPLALAASMAILVGHVWLGPRVTPDTWVVASLQGARPGGAGTATTGPVAAGEWLQTDRGGHATLRAPAIGTVNLGPDTRLRIVAAGPGRHLLELAYGSLEANVTAAPGEFSVDTAAARAVDLGCHYTLEVDRSGAGRLHVTLGWVGLSYQGRESLVPAGALCATRASAGPGTPYFEGATPAFVEALAALDGDARVAHDGTLQTLLAAARPIDAISLWYLLTRLDTESASRVFDTLATLAPPSPHVTRARVLAGDAAALAAWWEDIGLGDIAVLRQGMVRFR